MNAENYLPIAQCDICSHLDEYEYSLYKYGWPEQDRPLPAAAARLNQVEDPHASYDQERYHLKRCPNCGIYYRYSTSYEYLVNGSEDEEELTRLTPTQVHHLLAEEEYHFLIQQMENNLASPDPLTRSYAAKCLTAFHLENSQPGLISTYLKSADPEILKGALHHLRTLVEDKPIMKQVARLKADLAEIAGQKDHPFSGAAGYVLSHCQED